VSLLFTIKEYFKYRLRAQNLHGVHSPFVYEFNEAVVNDKRDFYDYEKIELLRSQLYKSKDIIEVQDFGAGSHFNATNKRSVASIAKNAGRKHKHGQLLFKMVNHYQPNNILELGTSLGLGTSYLALAKKDAWVTTIEGGSSIAEKATIHFNALGLNNVVQVVGKFDDVLANTLQAIGQIDFLFIDGNHSFEPTIDYYKKCLPYLSPNSIILFDDIYWSKGMSEAWQVIKDMPESVLTVDVFQFGIVFFSKQFKEKQSFTIKY
jgi:predicted O-methyltransferase YrrM